MLQKIGVFLFILACCSCKEKFTGDTLLSNTTIVDVTDGSIKDKQDVLIIGDRIIKIVTHGTIQLRASVVIDGTGKYLVPGFWDMHAHMMRNKWYLSQMPLMRANGIVGFREMWGDLKIADTVQSEIEKGRLPFFRFIASGHILDGKKPFWNRSIPVADPLAARQIVDSLIANQADFIKVYSFLSPEVFHALADHCRSRSIAFAGHVPHLVPVTEASRAGMASMEHLYGMLLEACTYSDSAMRLMQRAVLEFELNKKVERKKTLREMNLLLLKNFSAEKMRMIARTLKKNNTYIVPTLVLLRGEYFTNDSTFTNDSRLKYLSQETKDYWKEVTVSDKKNNDSTDWQLKRDRWQLEMQVMKILVEEKVQMLGGTDADNPYVFPGFSLHDELQLFVECGMSPLEALQTVTINPARFLKDTNSRGRIHEGMFADVVLLRDNPLKNISATKTVHTVVANGKLYGSAYIDSVLSR